MLMCVSLASYTRVPQKTTMKTAALGIGVSGLSLTPLIDNGMYLTYIAGLVISYTAGFIFTYFFGFKEEMADGI